MRRLALYAVAALLFLPMAAYCAPSATSVVESHMNGGTILSSQPAVVFEAVKTSVSENQKRAADFVTAVLSGGRADANAMAAPTVTAAINGLSTPKSPLIIAQIIEAATKATPDMVLKIVRAAILCSPKEAAPAIVRAAVASLKNPGELAEASPDTVKAIKGFKEFKDFKQVGERLPDGLTTPEKIVQTALQADPSLDADTLTQAATQGNQILTNIPVDNGAHYAIWPPVWPPPVPVASQ